ncbi:MAG: Wzz/FepE/Etk N-terminal domain-containing protein [Candidatus Zixiibacteriota bacterium]
MTRFTLWDYVRAVVNRRRLIFLNVIGVMIISISVSWMMPKWYKARALILPPEEQGNLAGLIGNTGLAGIAATAGSFALPVLASESDVMATMLKSRTVLDAVIDSFDLTKVYEATTRESTRLRMLYNLNVDVGSDGVIKLEYVDKDSIRCAAIANALIKSMDWVRSELSVQRARETRMFVQQKLAETEEDIAKAEDSLTAFQRKYKIIAPEVQATATIQAAANLRAEMILKEIELDALRATHSENHPNVILIENAIAKISEKITELESGLVGLSDSSAQYLSIPFSNVPDLTLKYGQLVRNLKIHETVFQVLTQQLEQAKIQETRETPTVSVLDWAVPPAYKFKPKKARIGLTAGFLALIATLLWIFLKELWLSQRLANNDAYRNLLSISNTLKRDFFGFRGRKVREDDD